MYCASSSPLYTVAIIGDYPTLSFWATERNLARLALPHAEIVRRRLAHDKPQPVMLRLREFRFMEQAILYFCHATSSFSSSSFTLRQYSFVAYICAPFGPPLWIRAKTSSVTGLPVFLEYLSP